jgi:AcrR family transcriptional regulator
MSCHRSRSRPGSRTLVSVGERDRRDDVRRSLLDAMVATVAERGYERTRIEDVAARAAVTAELFWEYFVDKDACLLAALDEVVGEVARAVARSYDRAGPWPERVLHGLRVFLAALADNPAQARVAMVESVAAGSLALERYRAAFRGFIPFFEDGREHASHPERLSEQTAAAIVGGIASVVQDRVRRGETAELRDLLPSLAYFALAPYLGRSAAAAASGLPLPA